MNQSRRSPCGFALIELLTIIIVVGLLLMVLSPAILQSRDEARMKQCQMNLKQLGIALFNYEETYASYPPGWTNRVDTPGKRIRYGWSTGLLPFIDQVQVYERLDFNTPSAEHPDLVKSLPELRCPADRMDDKNPLRGDFGTSNYSGNFGSESLPRWVPGGLGEFWPGQGPTPRKATGIFWLNSSRRYRDVMDGLSNVFLLGERGATSGGGLWLGVRGNDYENDQVTDCSFGNEINSGFAAFSSDHGSGAWFLMGDGAVRFVSDSIESSNATDEDMGLYQRLSHISDNNPVPDDF